MATNDGDRLKKLFVSRNEDNMFTNIVREFNPASTWYAFEHIVYQNFMVAYHDFKFIIKGTPNGKPMCSGSLLECGFQNKGEFKPDWSPLWIPAYIENYVPEEGLRPFYLFHTDRLMKHKGEKKLS